MNRTVIRTCPFCRQPNTVEVPEHVLGKWDGGEGVYLQEAWPDGTPDQREALQTGIHPQCWDNALGADEDVEGPVKP